MIKKCASIVSLIIAVAFLLGSFPTSLTADAAAMNIQAEQKIYEFYDKIDSGEWDDWAMCFAPCVRERYISFTSNEENLAKGVGILCVRSAEILEIEPITLSYQPDDYGNDELRLLLSSDDNYSCYKLHVRYEVEKPNDYFSNGDFEKYVLLVRENGEWYVAAHHDYFEYECPIVNTNKIGKLEATRDSDDQSNMYTFCNARKNINVFSGTSIHSVPFVDFIINTTCNEIGNMMYDDDAIIANIIAIKMCGWYCFAHSVNADEGYDIVGINSVGKTSLVAYDHGNYNGCLQSQITRITSLVNTYMKYYMVTSAASGGKLFFPNYRAGSANANGAGGGRLYQNGSNYLATNSNYGYSWKQILHYYYDNSQEIGGSVGIVQIKSCSHSPDSSFYSDGSYHWHQCTRCTAVCNKSQHTWVSYPTYFECSVCGRRQTEVALGSPDKPLINK